MKDWILQVFAEVAAPFFLGMAGDICFFHRRIRRSGETFVKIKNS
jgi:hypothetical protein